MGLDEYFSPSFVVSPGLRPILRQSHSQCRERARCGPQAEEAPAENRRRRKPYNLTSTRIEM